MSRPASRHPQSTGHDPAQHHAACNAARNQQGIQQADRAGQVVAVQNIPHAHRQGNAGGQHHKRADDGRVGADKGESRLRGGSPEGAAERRHDVGKDPVDAVPGEIPADQRFQQAADGSHRHIGQRTAEELKKNVACCPQKTDFHETMEIKGRSLLTGLPVRVNVSTDDLYDPVMMLSEQIGTAAHQVLEKTPPELAGDIYRNGVMLTGGGAQLHGLTEYLSQELKVEVTVSPDPVNCVALGTAQSLSIGDKLETGFTDATPRIGRR